MFIHPAIEQQNYVLVFYIFLNSIQCCSTYVVVVVYLYLTLANIIQNLLYNFVNLSRLQVTLHCRSCGHPKVPFKEKLPIGKKYICRGGNVNRGKTDSNVLFYCGSSLISFCLFYVLLHRESPNLRNFYFHKLF